MAKKRMAPGGSAWTTKKSIHQDAYPLPKINNTLDSLACATYFTTLDHAFGYWQVEVEQQEKKKTAFEIFKGHFELNVMPFDLTTHLPRFGA